MPDAPSPASQSDAAERRRLQSLHRHAILDTPPEAEFDQLTRLASEWLEVPIALVSLIDAERQWFKSRVGLDVAQTPRDIAFCSVAIEQPQEWLVVPDAAADPRFRSNPLVTGEPHIRFYAGVPLVMDDGQALGTLCVIDRKPREFTAHQREVLGLLARQVVATLELRRRHAELQDIQALNAQIIGTLPVGLSIYDAQGQCVSANEALARMIGASLPQVLAQNYHQIPSWRDAGLYEAAQRCMHTGQAQRVVVHLRSTFGQAVWGSADFVALEQGGQRHLMLTLSDVTGLKQAEQAQLAASDRYQKLYTHMLDGVLQTEPGGAVFSANPAACALLGLSEAEICRRGRDSLLDLADPRLDALLQTREREGHARGELRMRRGDGALFEVELTSALYQGQDGRRLSSIVFRDITERQRWEAQLQAQVDLLDNLARHVPGVVYQYQLFAGGRSCFPYATQGLWEIYEVRPQDVREDAAVVFSRLHPDDLPRIADSIRVSAETLQPWREEYRVVLPQQGLRWRLGDARPQRQPDGSVLWHGYITDITARKAGEARTYQLAYYDALTGLPNRVLLRDRLDQALVHARRAGQHGALMFLDLDNFKQINDARGHSVGDRLLRAVAQRLQALLRAQDTVARIGGDEFVLLLTDLGPDLDGSARAAMAVAEKLRAALEQPYPIDSLSYTSTASLGISVFPKGPQAIDDLLREADTAMYRAKAAGRNRIAFFELGMQHEVEERLALEQDLKQAVARGQFALHVQGQVDAQGEEVAGEVLLRWHHPERGLVPPAKFIPLAEESGLIHPIGEWVIEQACLLLARLRQAGRPQSLSVNVSARQFRHEGFVERVQAILQRTQAPAQHLIFEVTESLFIHDWDHVLARMSALVKLGIRFSIDDFGTGYSSLAYLQRLPLFEIKIDRSFVRDVPHDVNGTAIVNSILSMARHLGLEVVAEGVENQAQADYLLAQQCSRLQGYWHSQPQAAAQWLQGLAPAGPRAV